MKCRFPVCYAFLAVTLALSGCAGNSDRYPSLQIRPGERVSGTFEPVPPAPVPTTPPAASEELMFLLTELHAQALAAHRDFLTLAPGARQLADAAANADVGSNSWARAQVALAELDSARSRAAIPLGQLDVLYVDATVDNEARGEIGSMRDDVLVMVREEDAILADLRAKVR